MEKHTSYFNLLEQLKEPDCPVCVQTRKSLQSFLDSYLYEGVNDDTNWNRLSAAGGWCARHGRQLEGFSDGLAVALFYRHLIRKRLAALGAPRKKGFFSKSAALPPCPACVYEEEVELGQLRLLAAAMEEPEFMDAFGNHPGLCLPHVEASLELMKEPLAGKFKALAGLKLEALCAELDEIVRKSDHTVTEKMGPEGGAWKRALARINGLKYFR